MVYKEICGVLSSGIKKNKEHNSVRYYTKKASKQLPGAMGEQ